MRQPAQASEKVPLVTKLSFGAGDVGPTVATGIMSFLLLYFFTDVARISPALAIAGYVTPPPGATTPIIQPDSALLAIRLMTGPIPAVILLAGICLVHKSPSQRRTMRKRCGNWRPRILCLKDRESDR